MSCLPGDTLGVTHPVLQGQEHSVRIEQRTNTLRCRIGIVGLDAKEDQINRSHLVGAIRCPHRQRKLSREPGLDRQCPGTQRFEVGPASDERHLFPGPGQ